MLDHIALALALLTQPRAEFEVASVKPYAPPPTAGRGGGGCTPFHKDRGRVDICGPLAAIIAYAYAVPAYRIEGPDFVHDRRALFQIQAKLPDGASPDQMPEMLRALLADRFHLAVHRGTRQQEMTAMVVAKGGLKMKPASGDDSGEVQKTETAGPTIRWQSSGITLAELAALCDGINFVPPVVDMTGVKGRFQVDLAVHLKDTFAAAATDDDAHAVMHDAMMRAVDDGLAPLGLHLELRKGTVDTVVVDHVEKTPTGN
jgi:uncharacterized protein (TIGR03435 family)